MSNELPVISGVPQGSILGPLLFIMYINNVITTISPGSEINMFADDIALYYNNNIIIIVPDLKPVNIFSILYLFTSDHS